jgi:hypothetical protein
MCLIHKNTECVVQHLACAGHELTTLVVINTDCTGSYKANYHIGIRSRPTTPIELTLSYIECILLDTTSSTSVDITLL